MILIQERLKITKIPTDALKLNMSCSTIVPISTSFMLMSIACFVAVFLSCRSSELTQTA